MNNLARLRWQPQQSSCRFLHMIKKKYDLNIKQEQMDKLDEGQKHRKHLGTRHNPCVKLPYQLNFAAKALISKYNNKRFRREIERIRDEFYRLSFEDQSGVPKPKIKGNFDYEDGKEAEVFRERRKSNDTKPVALGEPYNHAECVAYMASRLPANYAALSLIFNEIRHEEPNFHPSTLFDFGSGVGSTIWAADHYWGNRIKEIFCVDLNENMNEVSRQLLERGTFHDDNILDKVFYRQFLPIKHQPAYDLVVSAFSLLDTNNLRNRIYTVENLWKKTSGMLVLVEHGSKAGFQAIMEARNFLLQISNKQLDPLRLPEVNIKAVVKEGAHPAGSIVAPCPHDLICPRQLVLQHKSFCNFTAVYNEIDYGQKNVGTKTERFAYCVIKKNKSSFEFQEEQKHWPRVVEPVVRKHAFAICRLCTSDGLLKEVKLGKARSEANIFMCARKSKWGDKLPAEVVEKATVVVDDIDNDNEDKSSNDDDVEKSAE